MQLSWCIFRCSALIVKFLEKYLGRGAIFSKLAYNVLQIWVAVGKFKYFITAWINAEQRPNGHILVDSQSIRRRNSMWKVRRNYIDFERQIHVEIKTSIRRGNFDVDSTFKIDEISMSFPRGFFDLVSTSNLRNFCAGCFHCINS